MTFSRGKRRAWLARPLAWLAFAAALVFSLGWLAFRVLRVREASVAAAPLADEAAEAQPLPPVEADLPGAPSGAPREAGSVPRETRAVKVFFESAEDGQWAEEERSILRFDSPAAEARQAVAELLAGPRAEGHLATTPKGTRLLHLLVSPDGTAFADFSREFADPGELGGSDAEIRAVGAVVRTLTENFPVARVRILVEGGERETLHGHVRLAGAFRAGRVVAEAHPPAASRAAREQDEGAAP